MRTNNIRRAFIIICIVGLLGLLQQVAAQQVVTPEGLRTVLNGATASLDRYQSGRISYETEHATSTMYFFDEEIEEEVNRLKERLKKGGASEEFAISAANRDRERMRTDRTRTRWGQTTYACQYTFAGDSSSIVLTYNNTDRKRQRYFNMGKETIIEDEMLRRPDGEKARDFRAYVRNGNAISHMGEFQGPIADLLQLRELMKHDGWMATEVSEKAGEVVYTLEYKELPSVQFAVDVIPEKEYFIRRIILSKGGESSPFKTQEYSNEKWLVSANLYFPMTITTEFHSKRRATDPADDRVARETMAVKDVELNVDIPIDSFDVPFMKDLMVTDYRFDPPRTYRHTHPDALDEYLRKLDEQTPPKK